MLNINFPKSRFGSKGSKVHGPYRMYLKAFWTLLTAKRFFSILLIFWTKIKFSAESKRLSQATSNFMCIYTEANSIDQNLPIWYTFCGHFTQMRFFIFFHPVLRILLLVNEIRFDLRWPLDTNNWSFFIRI